jgi:hypothetical protein
VLFLHADVQFLAQLGGNIDGHSVRFLGHCE